MRERKKKRIIIISLLGLLCIMTVGYAAFQSNLKIKGTSSISSNWNILITNVEEINQGGEGENAKAPTWTSLTANVEANLYSKGDYVEYLITIENKGTVDAVLSNITPTEKEYKDKAIKITYSGVNINDKLYKEEKAELKVKIEYNPEYGGVVEESSSELEIILEYTQAEIAGEPVLNSNLYVSNSGDDETGIGTTTKPYKTIEKAYSEASDNSTIYIMDDITQTETLNLNENKNITITSHGVNHSIIRGNDLLEYVINFTNGTLTLENIVLDGNKIDGSDRFFVVNGTNAELNIENGAVIKNNYKTVNDNGAGSALRVITGTVNMNGGEISYNKTVHGTVGVSSKAKFNLNGGSISHNEGIYGGGFNGWLQMNGGEISYNKTTQNGGGAVISGGYMKGGYIHHNESVAGAGLRVYSATFEITGGTISNNIASSKGGGIYISNGTLDIGGNTTINSNESVGEGGGLYSDSSTVTIDNVTMNKNNITGSSSPGSAIFITNGQLTLNNGTITNNTCIATGSVGGAIRVYTGATFIMNGGTIANNSLTGNAYGAGVACHGADTKFIMNGGIIKNNKTVASANGGVHIGTCTYTYKAGIICGNTPANSYETHTTCPS